MANFGKRPPRALESFGVAGLLGEECRVLYASLFSPMHLGKVSDLMSARLQKAGADELRLRALLLFTTFEAYRTQMPRGKGAQTQLDEPMVLECGIDNEKLAIGTSFTWPEGSGVTAEGLADRVSSNEPKGGFEELLVQLASNADRLVIRVQASIRRLEVVSLVAIPGKVDRAEIEAGPAVEVVEIGNTPQAAPKATEYVELGDLDYARLLKENALLPNAPATGELLANSAKVGAAAPSEGTALQDAMKVMGQNGATAGLEKVKIAGTTSVQKDAVFVIKGGAPAPASDNSVIKVSGAGVPGPTSAGPVSDPALQAELFQSRIQELQKRIAELEAERANSTTVVSEGASPTAEDASSEADTEVETETEASKPTEAVKGLFKKLWGFAKKKSEEDEGAHEEPADEEESSQETASQVTPSSPSPASLEFSADPVPPSDTDPASAAQAAAKTAAGSNTEVAVNSLMAEIQAGSLDRTIGKAQKEAAALKKELGSGKARKFVDGLMEDLVAEKARLHEMAKKLNLTIRQKELEFRNKEQGYHQELHRRDEMIRQKNSALNRTKDQLAQSQMTMERMKSTTQNSSEDSHYRQKYNQTQRLLNVKDQENEQLKVRVEELRSQLTQAQYSAATKLRGPTTAEHAELQKRSATLQRQLDEYKRSNVDLLNKLNERKKERPTSAGAAEELKGKLEAAMKLATTNRKEADVLKLRVEELEREEQRLKTELARLNRAPKAA